MTLVSANASRNFLVLSGGRSEGVHQSRVGKAPGNEVKGEYSEKSVLATASQASTEVSVGHLPITPVNAAARGLPRGAVTSR